MNRDFIFKAFFVFVSLILLVPFAPDMFATPEGVVSAMFIEAFTGVTEKVDIQIQKSCRAIAVIAVGTVPMSNATLVSQKLVTRDGNVILMDQIPANDLAEIMSQDEGLFMKDMRNYAGTFPFAGAVSIHIYPVGFGGAVKLEDNNYLSLDLRGLTSANTYRIYALESTDQDGAMWDVEKKAVPSPRTSQRFNVNGEKLIALPRTNFDKIQIFGRDGKDCIYTGEELGIMSIFENDIVAAAYRTIATTPVVNVIDVIFGYDNLFLVNIEDAVSYEIYCTGAAGYSFYSCNAHAMRGDQIMK